MRKRKVVDYEEDKNSGDEDIGDLSDESEYMIEPEVLLEVEGDSEEDSSDESSDEFEVKSDEEDIEEETREVKTGIKWNDKSLVPPESDAEEEDTEEVTEARLLGKRQSRQEMSRRVAMVFEKSPDKFVPDRIC